MRRLPYILVLFFGFSVSSNAQNLKDQILFTVAGDEVTASEFVRVYSKNLNLVQDESQKDVDEYLKLFINYKLKIKEAKSQGLDKKQSYIRELASYKAQLAKNYVTNKKVTDELVEEAYDRTINEVNVSHMLIRVSENASPQDTLVAYNDMLKIRNRAISEGFDVVKNEFMVQQGKIIAEDLGYFSGFKMVYRFEDVAYNTNVGEISMPFKTRFGYHILKVHDKRKSRGTRTVAHIMINAKNNDTISTPEARINEIYAKLNQGENFEALAKQFSEDKGSASKGGKLQPFSGGQLSSQKFEDVAFGLESINDVSEPFLTKYGWHIIKLLDKQAVKSFEELKAELTAKVKRDSRSQIINNALTDTLKNRYKVKDNPEALVYFESILNNNFYGRSWSIPTDFPHDKLLFNINEKQITYRDFANHLVRIQRRPAPRKPFKSIINEQYNDFLNKTLVQYQEDNLENENPDFANILNEYRDGLLLFDLMENTIWNASKTDSVGLQSYYDAHAKNYVFKESIDAVVASSNKQKVVKKAAKLLKDGVSPEDIKMQLNAKNKIEILFTSGKMDRDHQALPKDLVFAKGVSNIYKHNDAFVVVKINDVYPEQLMTFEEAKGRVISDFQDYKEQVWLEELAQKFKVVLYEDVLLNVKNHLNH